MEGKGQDGASACQKCINLVNSAAGDSDHSSQGRQHARGRNFFTFPFIRTRTSQASPRTFITKNCRVQRVLQGHPKEGTHILQREKLTCTFLHTPAHTHTGMRATKMKVNLSHMEDRLYIHRNFVYKIWIGKLDWNTCLFSKRLRRALLTLTSWLSTRNGLMSKVIYQTRSCVCIN